VRRLASPRTEALPQPSPTNEIEDPVKKLKLDVESLKVESFEARPAGDAGGTVLARHNSTAETCSMSVDVMCIMPQDTITADVYAGQCNTQQCQDGGSLTRMGCATNMFCV
jgi:hypothetical protein